MLLIGFDAADGDLVLDWVRQGRLPTLAALAQRGTAVPLRSVGEDMPESSWASMITGSSPGDHGIYSWRIVRPGGVDRMRMANGGWRRPFWWVLRRHAPDPKPRALVFDIPYAGGLRDDGVTEFAGWGLRVTRQGKSWPPELFEQMTRRHSRYPAWINRDYNRNPFSERRYRRVLARLARRRTALALDLLDRFEWDCALLNFTEPHFAGHAFFHHLNPAEPAARSARFGATDGLLDAYLETDRAVGRLLEAAGPDTDVIVFSTIGLRPNEIAKDLLRSVLVALGYEVPAAPTPRGRLRRIATMVGLRVLPRFLRHRVRKLVPVKAVEDAADAAWGEAIDWSRSRAVSEAEPGSSWIRLNMAGRGPQGIVTVEEREGLIAEIVADLGRLLDDATGEPAVAEVIPVAELAPGRLSAQMPDLLVRWKPGKRIRAVRHPRVGVISDGSAPYARTEHTGAGFLVAAGPSIEAGAAPDGDPPREIDLAPTVLHAFGSPVPEAMSGRVLEWLLAGERDVTYEEIDVDVSHPV
jgi:predicted AlkP superfamily phosphohydrolase/phosphomutase